MSSTVASLLGQETLLACWSTLAQMSPGARLIRSSATVAAVFPSWAPLNNAIMLDGRGGAAATTAASDLASVYAEAGVDVWALWLPSRVRDLDTPDAVRDVGGLERDTTTLVMQGTLPPWRRRGLAPSLVEHVLADAMHRGARTATLQSTRMGQQLYESLGFEPVGRYEEWISR